ncbi:hypothetical protein ABIF86_002207 [Bradyrhizobium japonicum]
MLRYKIFFHVGNELSLKTHASKGEAWIDGSGLNIRGSDDTFLIPRADIQKVDMYRFHGLGRVIQVDHSNGRLFLAVTRLMIGQFALINFFRTGKLHRVLLGTLPNG